MALSLAVLGSSSAASATGYDLNDFVFDPGSTVTLADIFSSEQLNGWAPDGIVEIFFLSDPVKLGEETADAAGAIAGGDVTIPADAALGVHKIELRGNGANGAARVEFVEIVVFNGPLPTTGSSNVALMLGVAFLAFAVGSGLVATNRRREAVLID